MLQKVEKALEKVLNYQKKLKEKLVYQSYI